MIHPKSTILFIIAFYSFGCGSDQKKTDIEKQQQDSLCLIDTTECVDGGNYTQAYNKALALWQTPFVEKNFKTHFGNAHVIISGPENAEPLVLLHGMNASSTMWYPNVKALSEQYRIYAIDFLLEPGKSRLEGESCTKDETMEWYYEIFDQLQLKKFSLMGASRGGWLAVNIALHSKNRVNKIVLLSPAQTFTWIKPMPGVISNIAYSISPKRKDLRNVMQTMTVNIDQISQDFIDQYYIATTNATLISTCILQMTPFSDKELQSLTMPVLVLIGDDDIINSDSALRKAKKLIPHVETKTIQNAGHFLSFDQAELVNKTVLDFLNVKNNLSVKK